MQIRSTLSSCALVSAAAIVLGASLASPASAATPPDLTGSSYVALGDSYSAGFGILPFTTSPADGCYQSDSNYPHLVATQLGLVLDDRTCSGAVTANVTTTPQLTITGAGTAPVQDASLSASTKIVTITIGGNDLGFADVAASCIAQSANGPLVASILGVNYANCREYYAPEVNGMRIDQLKYKLDNTVVPALDATFATIRQLAPNATIIAIGYPTISPDFANRPTPPASCYSSPLSSGQNPFAPPFPTNTFPFTDIDTGYLHGVESELDAAIGTAATAHGAIYVSTLDASAAHSACAGADAYIAGISLTTDLNPNTSQPLGSTGFGLLLGALHPNAAGVAFLQQQVVAAIQSTLATDDAPAPPPAAGGGVAAPTAPRLAESGAPDSTGAVASGVALIAAGVVLLLIRRGRFAHRSAAARGARMPRRDAS